MTWQLLVDHAVQKQFRKIPQRDAERIFLFIQALIINPYAGDIEKMKGEKDVWRRRIGSYRIFYEVNTLRGIIYVFDVQRRTSKTY